MVIKMLSDKSLVMTTKNSVLHQRESAVEAITFLIPATFHNNDLTGCVFSMIYKTPANESFIEVLTAEEELRDDTYIVLHAPVDSAFTRYAGDMTLMIQGVNLIEETGTNVVLNTGEIKITIEPVPDYFAFVSDQALNSITEQLLNLQAKADELAVTQEQINQESAKDLAYTSEGHVNLVTENGTSMGDGITILHSPQIDNKDDGQTDLDEIINNSTYINLND